MWRRCGSSCWPCRQAESPAGGESAPPRRRRAPEGRAIPRLQAVARRGVAVGDLRGDARRPVAHAVGDERLAVSAAGRGRRAGRAAAKGPTTWPALRATTAGSRSRPASCSFPSIRRPRPAGCWCWSSGVRGTSAPSRPGWPISAAGNSTSRWAGSRPMRSMAVGATRWTCPASRRRASPRSSCTSRTWRPRSSRWPRCGRPRCRPAIRLTPRRWPS